MTDPAFNVGAFCSEAVARRHRITMASLPLTFGSRASRETDIALVGAETEAIADALSARPKVIVLDRPAAASPESLKTLLGSGIAVFPVLPLAAALISSRAVASRTDATLVRSCLASTQPAPAARLEHLAALETALGALADVALIDDAGDAYSGTARTMSGARVLWNGRADADSDRFDLDVVGIAERFEIDVGFSPTARPAKVRMANADGSRQMRDIFESGLRLFWREIALAARGKDCAAVPLSAAAAILDNPKVFNTHTP